MGHKGSRACHLSEREGGREGEGERGGEGEREGEREREGEGESINQGSLSNGRLPWFVRVSLGGGG